MKTSRSRYTIDHAEIADRELVIVWGDGHRSRYHPIWLRHQCECNRCGSPLDAIRNIYIHQIPEDIAPKLLTQTADEVRLGWSNDDHRSAYRARWLRDHCCSDQERAARTHRPILWDRRLADHPPSANLTEAEANPRARLAMLRALGDYGFCKIDNVPTEPGQAHRLVELVGPRRQTHYGDYTLSKKADVDNVGDTAIALLPHIDETYRLSTIGIIAFQVLRPSSKGGDSTLVDGFEAARRLREAWPEDFDLLTKTPVTTQRFDKAQNSDRQPRRYLARLPVLKVDGDGAISGVRLNERQITPLELPSDRIGPCYTALRRIFDIVYDPDLRLTFKLKAGEGLLFNNQRVLHGRTEFTPEDPARSVLTTSIDLEEFHSTLRMLHASVEDEDLTKIYSQGMAV